MPEPGGNTERSLRILHVFRSPVGGLFRHVLDLAGEQARQGHAVGFILDSATGGERATRLLADLAPRLTLGTVRFPMRRDPHPADVIGLARVARIVALTRPDVIHGHGSKGALYARLAGSLPFGARGAARVYTPHGGSLHFRPGSLKGALVLGTERLLTSRSDLILFESAFAAERFRTVVGGPTGLTRIVLNGLAPAEFAPVQESEEAADFLFVGELRMLKGVDVLLKALAGLPAFEGRRPTAALVGSGPDRQAFEDLALALGLEGQVQFKGALPAREAFGLGRTLVVPSRAESLPYIVLEAAAARRPLIATRVGGIPEILGRFDDRLVPGEDVNALREAMAAALARTPDERMRMAAELAVHVQATFSVGRMVEGVMGGYREALAAGARGDRPALRQPFLRAQRSGS